MAALVEDRKLNQPQFSRTLGVNAPRLVPESHELEELAQEIRRTLPLPTSISRLELNREAGVVEVTWQSRNFVVKSTHEVFELKGKLLYINGASLLIQAVLEAKENQGRAAGVVSASLEKAEELFKMRQMEAAYSLLQTVKATLQKLAGLKSATNGLGNNARRTVPTPQNVISS